MQRVHPSRHLVYSDKDFQIRSIDSLVKLAKARSMEKMEKDNTDNESVPSLSLQGLTERLTENLHDMHHHLQHVMANKFGKDAQHVIAAERTLQQQAHLAGNSRLPLRLRQDPPHSKGNRYAQHPQTGAEFIAKHLSEIGRANMGDELELLKEYRERYACILGDLLVLRDSLVEFEKGLEKSVDDTAKLTEELSDLIGVELGSLHSRATVPSSSSSLSEQDNSYSGLLLMGYCS
jgi:hypothetical protein